MNTLAKLRAVPTVKNPPRSRRRASGIVGQVRAAFHPEARLATLIGACLGGFVPLAGYQVAHHEFSREAGLFQLAVPLVMGALLYSAKTVYDWGKLAFRSPVKAVGFVLLTEGVMITSSTAWLSVAALVLLAGVNAIATGATLSVERES